MRSRRASNKYPPLLASEFAQFERDTFLPDRLDFRVCLFRQSASSDWRISPAKPPGLGEWPGHGATSGWLGELPSETDCHCQIVSIGSRVIRVTPISYRAGTPGFEPNQGTSSSHAPVAPTTGIHTNRDLPFPRDEFPLAGYGLLFPTYAIPLATYSLPLTAYHYQNQETLSFFRSTTVHECVASGRTYRALPIRRANFDVAASNWFR